MWSEKLNNRRSDGGMTGDVCYRICTIERSYVVMSDCRLRHPSLFHPNVYKIKDRCKLLVWYPLYTITIGWNESVLPEVGLAL